MSITGDRIDRVVRLGLGPALKKAGYRKTARTFRQVSGSAIKITNLQASFTNFGAEGRFTINCGVYFPEVARLQGMSPLTERPLTSNCVVQRRIGQLLPIARDHWWEVNNLTDLAVLAIDVAEAWERYGRPWLDEHTDWKKARDFMLQLGSPYWAAIFSLAAGNRNEAAVFFHQALEKARDQPAFALILKTWGRQHGLP